MLGGADKLNGELQSYIIGANTAATTALERIWKDDHRYAKAGVMLNDFTGAGVSQLQLFDEGPPRPHSAELMKVLDCINHSGMGQARSGLPDEGLPHLGR